MSDIKWIKITTSMFEDEKIRFIESMPDADTLVVIWIKLLTLAGRCNATGYIFLAENIPYTEEMLATVFNMQLNIIRLGLNTFLNFGMIELTESHIIKIVNWEKYQNIEGLEKIREQTRQRVANFRSKQKLLPECNVTVTQGNAIDKNRSDQKRLNKEKNKRSVFTPPTIEEVIAYCLERQNKVDPQKFIDFYTSKGWMVGKNKMKDWKAAVRTWENNNGGQNGANRPNTNSNPGTQSPDSKRFNNRPLPIGKGNDGVTVLHDSG